MANGQQGGAPQQPSDDQLDVVQHPTLGTLKFPKDMSPEDRNASIEGALAAKSRATETNPATGITTPAGSSDTSILGDALGSMARRLGQNIVGAYHAIADPPTTPVETAADYVIPGVGHAAVRAAKGFANTEKTAYGQAKGFADTGQYARGAVTAASMLDPLATSAVTDINKQKDEGASIGTQIGTGAFDIFSMLFGQKLTGAPSEDAQLARLTTAVGKENAAALRASIPRLSEEIANGAPRPKPYIGEFADFVDATKKNVDNEFNTLVAPVIRKPVMPIEIERRIRSLITPDMAKTAEGRAKIAEINAAATEYQQPWTVGELNSARVTKNNELTAFYKQGPLGQMAKVKSDTQVGIDEAVRDGAAEIVYNEAQLANPGKPKGYFARLKQSQGALMNLSQGLHDHIMDLADKQLEIEGKTPLAKAKIRVVAGVHGLKGYASEAATEAAPLDSANQAVGRAYGTTTKRAIAAQTVRAMPLIHSATSTPQPPP